MIAQQHTHTHETQLYFLKERLEEEDGGYAWVGFVGRMRLGRRRTEGADVEGSAG